MSEVHVKIRANEGASLSDNTPTPDDEAEPTAGEVLEWMKRDPDSLTEEQRRIVGDAVAKVQPALDSIRGNIASMFPSDTIAKWNDSFARQLQVDTTSLREQLDRSIGMSKPHHFTPLTPPMPVMPEAIDFDLPSWDERLEAVSNPLRELTAISERQASLQISQIEEERTVRKKVNLWATVDRILLAVTTVVSAAALWVALAR